jgi:hypothetical protein
MASPLLDPARPAVEYGELGSSGADMLRGLSGDGLTVRVLRGSRARSLAGFFDETAAALQLPSYFGHNWAALTDCLRDIEGSVVIVVTEGESLLADAGDDQLALLLDTIASADQERQAQGGGRVRLLVTETVNGLWRIQPRLLALGRPLALASFDV